MFSLFLSVNVYWKNKNKEERERKGKKIIRERDRKLKYEKRRETNKNTKNKKKRMEPPKTERKVRKPAITLDKKIKQRSLPLMGQNLHPNLEAGDVYTSQ